MTNENGRPSQGIRLYLLGTALRLDRTAFHVGTHAQAEVYHR
ncbi:hypothetical protein [Hymenobacter glaciei]